MRSFFIINSRTAAPEGVKVSGSAEKQSGRRERLRFRDMVWAFHSESQDLLLEASASAYGGKMTWANARALGIALWINSGESLVGSPPFL